VLDKFDEGKRLTGGEIKAIVSKKEPEAEDADPSQIGGRSGLLKMVEAKRKPTMADFHRLTAAVLGGVERAVARFHDGKRIVMSTLANEVETDARHASDIFKDLAVPLAPNGYMPKANLQHTSLGVLTGWGAVQHSLYRLGGAGSWPARDEMEKWVVEVAHPALRFAVHGDPYVMSSKPSDPHNIVAAEADGNVKENDEPMLDREDADETTPSVSEAEMDAALNSLMAGTSAPVTPSLPR